MDLNSFPRRSLRVPVSSRPRRRGACRAPRPVLAPVHASHLVGGRPRRARSAARGRGTRGPRARAPRAPDVPPPASVVPFFPPRVAPSSTAPVGVVPPRRRAVHPGAAAGGQSPRHAPRRTRRASPRCCRPEEGEAGEPSMHCRRSRRGHRIERRQPRRTYRRTRRRVGATRGAHRQPPRPPRHSPSASRCSVPRTPSWPGSR